MEYMLSEALPIYSGGLGNVAGDQLKTASDLGVPVIGVGSALPDGYFRQQIDAERRQQALYPYNDPGRATHYSLREPNGEWLRLAVDFPGTKLWIRTWQIQLGRTKLYLLDTNDPANIPAHRGITSELYGGGPELRLKQEMVLGIGGWRLLAPSDCDPRSAISTRVTRRSRCWSEPAPTWRRQKPFDLALTVTRAGNLFTTHTPVEAGFDRFPPGPDGWYFNKYAETGMSISLRIFWR